MKQDVKHLSAPAVKERIYLYDNVKCLAIFLVVIGHAINFLTDYDGNNLEKSMYSLIYAFHMPLFIFISGLFVKPMNEETKFPKYKVLSFVLIGIVLRIMTSIVNLLLGTSPVYAVLDIYDTYAWFMWAMAVFTALTWLFRGLDKRLVLGLSFLVGCMAGYDSNLGDQFALMRIVVFFPIFLIGYYLDPKTLHTMLNKNWMKILAAVFIVAMILLFVFNGKFALFMRPMFTGRNRFTALDNYYVFGPFFRILSYLIAAAFGVAILCLMPNKNIGYLTTIGARTLQIYFWHKIFLIAAEEFHIYEKIEHFTGGTIATLIYILLAVGLTFFCSLKFFSFPTKQLLAIGKAKK